AAQRTLATLGVQVASMAPTLAIGSGLADPRYPKVGDEWTYRWVDTTTKQTKQLKYSVIDVAKDAVTERGGFSSAEPTERSHSATPTIASDEILSFSPYLLSFGTPAADASWKEIAAQRYNCRD